MPPPLKPLRQRVAENIEAVDLGYASECHIWTKCRNGKGYGRVSVNGRPQLAHRVSFVMECGPVPEGMMLDHLCRQRACINPRHLEIVTPRENTHRGEGLANGGKWNAAKTHCPSGHPYAGENLELTKSGHRLCRTCRREHGNAQRSKSRKSA